MCSPIHNGRWFSPLDTVNLVLDQEVQDVAHHLSLPPNLVRHSLQSSVILSIIVHPVHLVDPVQDEWDAEHDGRLENTRISLLPTFHHCAPSQTKLNQVHYICGHKKIWEAHGNMYGI